MDTLTNSFPPDLSDEDLQILEKDRICLQPTTAGKRKISATFLTPPTSDTSSNSDSSSPSASVRVREFDLSQLGYLDFPTTIHGVEALEFIGFTPATANIVFNNFSGQPDPSQSPYDLIDFACGHVNRIGSPTYADLTPRDAMTRVGLNQDLQDALLDPRFSSILWTETLLYWIRDTLRTNYAVLCRLQGRLKSHARNKKKAKRRSIQPSLPQVEQPQTQHSEVSITVNISSKFNLLPSAHIALASAGPLLPDHIVLYRGFCPEQIAFTGRQLILDDGKIDIGCLSTYPGGDFNHVSSAWYWTPEKEIGEKYRKWAARRSPWAETWVLRIQIPKLFWNSLSKTDLWYSRRWKEYVWFCKTEREPPTGFDSLWKEYDIIQGHICSGVTSAIMRIKREDVQTSITEEKVLLCDETQRKATQYAFMKSESVNRLGIEVRGKAHIDITKALDPESKGYD